MGDVVDLLPQSKEGLEKVEKSSIPTVQNETAKRCVFGTSREMNPTSLIHRMDDDDISLLLAEPDEASRQEAFDAVFGKYWKPMCFLLNEQGITNHADQEDIVSESFEDFLKHAQNGISLEGPHFRQLLFTIVKRRGIDHLRSSGARRRGAEAYEDYLLNETRTLLRREDASTAWLGFAQNGKALAMMEDFRAAVPTFPRQQEAAARAVALLVAKDFPLELEDIRDAMAAITGVPVTLPAAKSAWSAVRAKFREFLKNRSA
jgi:DNA-directed RNA polymerase specialized sigma24 family protein